MEQARWQRRLGLVEPRAQRGRGGGQLNLAAQGPAAVLALADQPLLDLPVAQLQAQFEQAIPRRMGVDLPPTA